MVTAKMSAAVSAVVARSASRMGAALISLGIGGFVAGLIGAFGPKAAVLVPALAAAVVVAFIPYSPLYAIIATTPVNVEIAGPVTVARLVIVYGFCVALFQASRNQAPMPRAFIWPEGTVATALFGWLLFASIAISPSGLLTRIGPYIIYAAIFFVILNYVDSERRLRNIFILLAVIGALQGLLVTAEAMFNFVPFGGWQAQLAADRGDAAVRVTGTSAHPIVLAGFFQVVIAFSAMLALSGRGTIGFLFFAGIAALALLSWWNTFARSSWIGLAAMIFTGMVLASRPTRILALMGATAGLLLLSAFDFSPTALIRYVESLNAISSATSGAGVAAGSDSFTWRLENWSAAFAMFRDYPIFGIGLDASERHMISYLSPGAVAHEYIGAAVPHNMFLVMLAEAGLPAFILFVFLWILGFRRVWQALRSARYRPYSVALAAALMGQIGTFFFNPMPREIWLTLGLAMALGRLAGQDPASDERLSSSNVEGSPAPAE